MNHRPVSQDRKVEGRAVEGDELRGESRDLVHEGRDQLLLGSFSDVRCPERIHGPVTAFFAVGNQRADTFIQSSPQVRF
jgi:hypothetical protein